MSNVNRYECIVVGGGLIGLLSAYLLAKQGLKVALLERSVTGRESSWAGGGILSPLYPWRYPDAVSDLVSWSRQHFGRVMDELQQQSGVDPEWLLSGMLILDQDERQQALSWAVQQGVVLEQVDQQSMSELEPALSSLPEQGLWMPEVGQVRNPRLLAAARGSAVNMGVTIIEQAEVMGLDISSGRVQEVITTNHRFSAEKVVIATGAWSAQLMETLGQKLEVEPVRGQMILFKSQPDLLHRITLNGGRYLIPRKDGHVLMGSTLERVGFDKVTTDEARVSLYQSALVMAPALADFPVVGHWAGLRPGSPEGIPMIGGVPGVDGLFVNVGHFRNGVAIGLASCQLLADLVLGEKPIIDPHSYSLP
jgi:glycine oxidase